MALLAETLVEEWHTQRPADLTRGPTVAKVAPPCSDLY